MANDHGLTLDNIIASRQTIRETRDVPTTLLHFRRIQPGDDDLLPLPGFSEQRSGRRNDRGGPPMLGIAFGATAVAAHDKKLIFDGATTQQQ